MGCVRAEAVNFTRQTISGWHETSDCGQYTVAAARVDAKFIYQANHKGELLLTSRDAQACRDACRDHALGKPIPEIHTPHLPQTGTER